MNNPCYEVVAIKQKYGNPKNETKYYVVRLIRTNYDMRNEPYSGTYYLQSDNRFNTKTIKDATHFDNPEKAKETLFSVLENSYVEEVIFSTRTN